MEALNVLSDLNFNIGKYGVSEIKNANQTRVGFHSAILNKDGSCTSGGYGSSPEEANKIACAEFIERSLVQEFRKDSESRDRWKLNESEFPTACGFAVGFSLRGTILRSLCEAVERYALSQWIDKKQPFQLENPPLCRESKYFTQQFQEVKFYSSEVPLIFQKKVYVFHVGVSLGLTKCGIFPGSNVSLSKASLWPHALLESFRHLLISRNTQDQKVFPGDRIHYFSKRKEVGLAEIPQGEATQLEVPQICFFRLEKVSPKGPTFIVRTILENWKPWHLGGVERFLY